MIQVFIRTSPFRDTAQYSRACNVPLQATNDSRALIRAALRGLHTIYRPGYEYAKAGVMLLNLDAVPQKPHPDLFEAERSRDPSRVMAALDAINAKFGPGAMTVGSVGLRSEGEAVWPMKQSRRSPRYTTRIDEIPVVLC